MDFSDRAQRTAFFNLHNGLPREGPGDRASVERALRLAQPLPAAPEILDIACGPGGQTLDLATLIPDARITALDAHLPFLHELERRVAGQGLAERIATIRGDMADLPFEPASFDLLWCEGAAYIIGLETALSTWRPLLRSGGVLALTEPVWLRPEPPARVRACWAQYPGMRDADAVRDVAHRLGYRLRGDFVLSPEAWWTNYYLPLERRVAAIEGDGQEVDAATRTVLDEARDEIDCYRRHAECYGYLFIVLRRD